MSHAPSDRRSPGFEVRVNGEPQLVPEDCSLQTLVELLGMADRKIAVAVNRQVVPRSRFATRSLSAGDRIEVLEAVGGG